MLLDPVAWTFMAFFAVSAEALFMVLIFATASWIYTSLEIPQKIVEHYFGRGISEGRAELIMFDWEIFFCAAVFTLYIMAISFINTNLLF